MTTNKRYFWLKLKDSFMASDAVDFLMNQPNGADYVVLYQMLCLKAINTNGELQRQAGEVIIKYDVQKIQRDCKYFDLDRVRVALEFYIKLGLVFVNSNDVLQIANFNDMVGVDTVWAEKKRKQRDKKKRLGQSGDNVPPNVL